MADILGLLTQQLGGNTLANISNQLGADQGQVQNAMGAALPLLLKALANNTQNQQGAEALAGALDRDHDGGILDNLGSFLGNKQDQDHHGGGILKHLLGGKQPSVENAISRNSGLSSGATSGLLKMLAPMLLGSLGKQKRQSGLDASGIAGLLGGLVQKTERRQPQSMGILSRLLDQDGDGSVNDDVLGIGMKFLGNMFTRR